jgi:hypothetical protein
MAAKSKPAGVGQFRCLDHGLQRARRETKQHEGDQVIPIPTLQENTRRRLSIRLPRIVFALGFAIACLVLLTPRTASAQASAGITGTVTDTTGAVIAAAQVTITNDATSQASHTVTSSAGTYSVKGIPPGSYTITVEAPGFKKAVQRGANVEVSTASTIDFTLTAGATNETVQVTADQIALNTTQPELGSTIEPNRGAGTAE